MPTELCFAPVMEEHQDGCLDFFKIKHVEVPETQVILCNTHDTDLRKVYGVRPVPTRTSSTERSVSVVDLKGVLENSKVARITRKWLDLLNTARGAPPVRSRKAFTLNDNDDHLCFCMKENKAAKEIQPGMDETERGSKCDLTETGPKKGVIGTGSKKDVTETGSKKDLIGTESKKDVTGTGFKKDVTGTGSKKDVTGTGSKKDVTGIGSKKDVTETGSKKDVTETGSKKDLIGTGSKKDVTGTGSKKDVTGTESKTDVAETAPTAKDVFRPESSI